MNRFPYISLKINASLVLLALLSACGGESNDGAASSNNSETEPTTSAAMVFSVGVDEDNGLYAEQAARTLQENLSRYLISSNVTSKRVHCPTGTEFDGTRSCFDLRVHIPSIGGYRAGILKQLAEENMLGAHLQSNASNLTHINYKGLAWGKKNMALLFALRNALEKTDDRPGAEVASARMALPAPMAMSSAATSQPVDALSAPMNTSYTPSYHPSGNRPTSYESQVFPPGCTVGTWGDIDCPADNKWVLVGLAARASDGKLSCMTGYFYNVGDASYKTVTSNCTNKEQEVKLGTSNGQQLVATGVSLKVKSNNVVGLGLAWGRPATEVDPIAPDFLLDVSKNNYKFSGSTDGVYLLSPSSMDSGWPFAIIGVGVNASKNNVDSMIIHLGYIGAEEVSPTDTWHGHTSEDMIAETSALFQEVFDGLVAEPFTFRVAYDSNWCDLEDYPSTLSRLDLCHRMAVYGAYYTDTAAVSSCYAGCDASYDYCKQQETELQECKSDPGNQCPMRMYFCEADLDACNAPCTDENTRVITMDITPIKGMETMAVERTWQNFLTDDSAGATETGISTRVHIPDGLSADVSWTLCNDAAQTDCVADVSTLTSSELAFEIRSRLQISGNDACSEPDINLYLDSLNLFNISNWDIDALVEDISAQAASDIEGSPDWIETSVYEIVNHSLQEPYQQAMKSVTDTLQSEIRERAREKPLLPCS